jgi:hypothetical protein
MELTERQKDTLLEFQQAIVDVKEQIRQLDKELYGLEKAYLEAYPVKTGDRIQYHDEEWIVLKVELSYRITRGEELSKPVGMIHLVKPTKRGDIPKNRVDGDKRIGLHEIGESKPVYDPDREFEL